MTAIAPRVRLWLAAILAIAFMAGTGAARAADVGDTATLVPIEHRRPADQTFLTFPEWFLVYSPDEYASFAADDRRPSTFPFLGHIGEFWQSYGSVFRETRNDRPFNAGYHLMIMVIGVSTTVEYAIRAGYEELFGRVAEATREGPATDEERYGAKVARDYVVFIRVEPWYQFDFVGALSGLWTRTSLWGPDLARKWERRYALTTEYLVKAGYGWLIKLGTRTVYDVASPVTAVVLDHLTAGVAETLPGLKVLETTPSGSVVATLPRYDAFVGYATTLARSGVAFQDIAGNRSEIVISVLADHDWRPPSPSRLLFSQPILTRRGVSRVVFAVQVPVLADILMALETPGLQVEHIYDF